MKRTLAAALAVAATLAVPSAASAHYYMDKAEAEADMYDLAIDRYGMSDPGVSCRPQGLNRPDPRYDYHRWVCGWYEDGCGGAALILGARSHTRYYYRILRGMRCEED